MGAGQPAPGPGPDRRVVLGRAGEQAAASWYQERGYVVLARNWRCRAGEIDLVLSDPSGLTIVFCEVKTRSGGAFGTGFDAVTPAKVRRLRALVGRWMSENRPRPAPAQIRLDAASVTPAGPGLFRVEVLESVG